MNFKNINHSHKYIKDSQNPILIKNEIDINGGSYNIWYWLTKVISWPLWYDGVSNIQILNQSSYHLKAQTKFKCKILNTAFTCEIDEFEYQKNISWSLLGKRSIAHQSYTIIPFENKFKIVAEVIILHSHQKLFKIFCLQKINEQHQIWLKNLKFRAEQNYPLPDIN